MDCSALVPAVKARRAKAFRQARPIFALTFGQDHFPL
jgi:hypothetical protein